MNKVDNVEVVEVVVEILEEGFLDQHSELAWPPCELKFKCAS